MSTTTTLAEVLTPDQLQAVKHIVDSTPDSMDRVHKLKRYLGQHREYLEGKGFHPEYLAYLIECFHLMEASPENN